MYLIFQNYREERLIRLKTPKTSIKTPKQPPLPNKSINQSIKRLNGAAVNTQNHKKGAWYLNG